jgi:hypothetical protein
MGIQCRPLLRPRVIEKLTTLLREIMDADYAEGKIEEWRVRQQEEREWIGGPWTNTGQGRAFVHCVTGNVAMLVRL